ncbi:hypothetical protein C9F11_45545 (plasmid) [Streptomyces sp. YIM 121038]|nr:hypothetical protein C9F11_45545 [Streptomyces sp. YIM 121038]
MVWGRVDRVGARRMLIKAVRRHLCEVLSVCGPDADAEGVLRERLKRRLAEQGHIQITDPVGWLMSRALPRRSVCLESRCDDGRRMDSRADCQACNLHILDRRTLRARAAQLASVPVHGDGDVPKAVRDSELRALWLREAKATAARHARTIRMRETTAAAAAEHDAKLQGRFTVSKAQPCVDCGHPQSAGLCGRCRDGRQLLAFKDEAVDIAVATWGRSSKEQAQQFAEQTRGDLQQAVEQVLRDLRHAGTNESEALDLAERLAIQSQLHAVREKALHCLATGDTAGREAERVFAAEMRCRHNHGSWEAAKEAAWEASETARWKTAHHLLEQHLHEVRATRARALELEAEADPYEVQADRVRAVMNWSLPTRHPKPGLRPKLLCDS